MSLHISSASARPAYLSCAVSVANVARLGDRFPNRRRRYIRRARITFAGILEHGNSDTAVVGELQASRLHPVAPWCRQACILARGCLGLIHAPLLRFVERQPNEVFQLAAAQRFAFRNYSHARLPPPDSGQTAGGTLAGGRYKAQQKRKKTRVPGIAETRRGTHLAS